jgi:hypothetical protein
LALLFLGETSVHTGPHGDRDTHSHGAPDHGCFACQVAANGLEAPVFGAPPVAPPTAVAAVPGPTRIAGHAPVLRPANSRAPPPPSIESHG